VSNTTETNAQNVIGIQVLLCKIKLQTLLSNIQEQATRINNRNVAYNYFD